VLADVKVASRRHLVFATEHQLDLLENAKVWFVDGTFCIVHEPFVQLVSIHAFIKSDGKLKQIPLAFSFMSGKRCCDYRSILKVIVELIAQKRVKK
jgi:hypothetical protein